MRLETARSLLFAPGSDERKLRRTLESGADAVVWDLEDGVAPAHKAAARALVSHLLAERPSPPCLILVRVNAAASGFRDDDLAVLEDAPVDGLVLPKATSADVADLGPTGPPVVALVETAAGIRDADALDLAAELGLTPLPD